MKVYADNMKEPVTIEKNEIEKIKKSFAILITTAPSVEAQHINNNLKPTEILNNKIGKFINGRYTYYFGKISNHNVIHVSCVDNGTRTMQGAISTINDAISLWKPKAIILAGIAFGNEKKYKIGDVLVAKHILDYEHQRIGEEEIITRLEKTRQGACLVSRVIDLIKEGWQDEKIVIGDVLSGEKLIDQKEFVKSLFTVFPEAVGGDMEGNALSYATYNNEQKIETILIKGICDYGYNKDVPEKDENQKLAMSKAYNVIEKLLSSDLGIKGIVTNDVNCDKEASIDDIWKEASISKKILEMFRQSEYYKNGKRYDIYKTARQNYFAIKGVDDKERDFALDKYLCETRKKANNYKYGNYDYDKYDVRPIILDWAKPIKDELNKHLGGKYDNTNIIFAGANYGREIVEILCDNISKTEIVSIDISSDATQRGQKQLGKGHSNINFITADFEKDHSLIQENHYDVYINLRSIHSSGVSKEHVIIMAEKWLKKGGLAVFSVSNGYLDKKDSKKIVQGMYGTNYSARKKDFSNERPYRIQDNIVGKLKTWGFAISAIYNNESEIFIFAKKK